MIYQLFLNGAKKIKKKLKEKWKKVRKKSVRQGIQNPVGKVCLEKRKDISQARPTGGRQRHSEERGREGENVIIR